MSWLNSSLNSIKGQITSFAQEVLAEVPIQDEEINPVQALEESQKRNEELNLLCASKDSEIAALRRQIVEFQAKCAESGRSSKSSLEKNASLEDSWIWEPENVLSDSSVKNDHEANSETSSGGEMITIPLDIATATESSSYEKLCKTSEDNQKLKKLVQENAALSEKVAQLRAKNKILNENLEELDSQHNAVIQKLLALKDELQEKFHKVSEDYEKLKTVHENEALNHERELDAVKKNLATYLSENEELKRSLDSLEECILKQTTENVNVKANLELKDKQLLELIEKIENWEGQNHQQHHEKRDNESVIDKLQKENDNFRKILEELGLDVEELKNGKELKNVFVKKHRVEDGFIILEDGDLGDGISWKQKYDELLLVKKELLDKLDESNQFPSTHKELEAEVELLRNTAISLDEQNKTYLDKINSLQASQLLENAAIDKKREQMETEIDLEIKVALLEKEKSILQSENQMNLARLEELKKVQTIDPEDYEKLKSDNEQLQENFSAANEEFMEYQEEQTKIRTKLEMRMKQLETEVLETQNKLHKAGNNEELELKVALLEKEKSILENDLLTNLERIEKLKISKTIDNEEYETIIEKNRQLQENFESANEEFMEYQEEQAKIRGELEAKVEYLENQIKECKILSSAVSMDNRCDKQTVKTIEIDEQLQKEDHHDDICKNFEQKVECLEKEISDANKSKQEIVRQLEEYKQFALKNSELQQKVDEIYILNEKYKGDIEKLKHKIEKCEANASDVESKLMMENVDLQKQLNDMESSMNQIQSDTQIANNSLVYSFDEIKELFSTYLQTNLMKIDKDTVEAGFKSIRDKIWKIDILERNLKQMSDEISRLVAEKSAIEHEKNTLQADVLNYEIECGELMKNNEILLNELDNYKRNKLETIHENNEDSIVILEKQLEDCSNLNRTLEDEYKELNQRIDDMENEKREHLSKIQSLQDINNNLNVTVKDLKLQLDAIEAEKCNLIFEINEMKTDDKKSAIDSQMQEYRNKMSGLEAQLGRLSKDHADLVAAMQSQQNNLIEYKREAEATISRLEKSLQGKDILIATKESEIKRLSTEHESMEKALLEGEHQSTTTNYAQLQADNEHLIKKLQNLSSEKIPTSPSSCDHEKQITQLNEEIASLNQIKLKSDDISLSPLRKQIEALNNEKAELIQTVTIKHNENLQYYMEIQRLGQLLQVEMEKSQNSNCENCTKLQNDIASMALKNANEVEKLKDQINFLMEKSDILTTNLLTEQTNQKLLHEEKSELVEQNSNLKKDLERLRHHLVELEDGHTQETLEMQKVIDETKAKMYELEEHASNSSTAYTSASIRANQHAETLQTQYQLVCQQRDEIAAQLSTAEDHELKNQAALVNLQCALEQFQKEREKDIQIATHRIRNELQTEKEKQKQLLQDIASLNQQLTDANQGLLAAARLSDQLEMSQVTISSLKEEITNLQNKNEILYEKLRITESSQADKIEKTLVKSLIIGYIVSSNPNDKSQILKMITIVLGFNQAETDKIGLNKNQTGWFGGLLNVGNTVTHGTDSLARAFVNFLEAESRPRDEASEMPNLLNIVSDGSPSSTLPSSSAKSDERKLSEPRTNQSAVQPILLNENVLEQFAPTRNSSSILKDILNDS